MRSCNSSPPGRRWVGAPWSLPCSSSLACVCLTILAVVFASPASAQPVDGVEAPAEYQRDLDARDDPSGTTDEIDAAVPHRVFASLAQIA